MQGLLAAAEVTLLDHEQAADSACALRRAADVVAPSVTPDGFVIIAILRGRALVG